MMKQIFNYLIKQAMKNVTAGRQFETAAAKLADVDLSASPWIFKLVVIL